MGRISGKSFDNEIMGENIHIEKGTATITDNTVAAQTRGIPDGWIDGDVACELEVEVSTKYMQSIIAAAKKAKSFQEIPIDDVMFFADAGEEELKVECFGVKWVMESILDFEGKGGELLTHKFKGFVTSPDFVRINGVPYLSSESTRGLLG